MFIKVNNYTTRSTHYLNMEEIQDLEIHEDGHGYIGMRNAKSSITLSEEDAQYVVKCMKANEQILNESEY